MIWFTVRSIILELATYRRAHTPWYGSPYRIGTIFLCTYSMAWFTMQAIFKIFIVFRFDYEWFTVRSLSLVWGLLRLANNVGRRSRKWWKRCFSYLLESLLNANVLHGMAYPHLHQDKGQQKFDFLRFQLEVAT